MFNEQNIKLRITQTIKYHFGNHDFLKKFIEYHTAIDKSELLPPFQSVLHRTVNSAHPNHIEINAKSLHNTIVERFLLPELHQRFRDYEEFCEQFRRNCLLFQEFLVTTRKKISVDAHKNIKKFLY